MRLQQLARDLWPYLQPLIEPMLRRAGSSSGGGVVGGAPSPHALNSTTHHSGTLADSQGPQFLMRDGSRSLVGDLAVAAGITVDGVDLSAHAADADAHHVRATAGNTGIDVTGQAISLFLNATASGLEIASGLRLADSIAGNGLTINVSKILAVGAGDGIDVNANDVAVDVTDIIDTAAGLQEDASNNIQIKRHTDSGLAFGLSGGLTLGTPTNVTATSTNSVSGVSHAHGVTASSNVGSSPAESLLKSTPGGGLTLASLLVMGGVDITNGGDLTVGSNVLFVDVSLASVGINRAPDPQFALDVNGPIRGTEIVGKHAIQLDDVALLCHFDGGQPYETNYTGEPNAIPLGQVPTNNQYVHYRPGKFYKAAVFGRSSTNLATNPSFENDLTGWSTFNGAGGDLANTRVTDEFYIGSACAKMTWTTVNNSQFYHQPVSSASAVTYTFSCWMRASVPTTAQIMISDGTTFAALGITTVDVTEDWQHFIVSTSTTPTAGNALRVAVLPLGSANTIWLDAVQLEASSIGSWYIDGTLGDGYAWTGTAHASTSTRSSGGILRYSLSNMVQHRWSVMGWFKFPHSAGSTDTGYLRLHFTGGSSIGFYHTSGAKWVQTVHNGGTSYSNIIPSPERDRWYHFAMTYGSGVLSFYLDGALVTSASRTFSSAPTTLTVGQAQAGTTGDVMVDDVVVSRQGLTANRVKAIYESDAPVFATSSVFSFRATPKGLVWADEEGLWMRTVTGNAVLGAYGGEATKSWGGITLEPADVVIGDMNRGAVLWWDDSQARLVIGKFGASTANLYLDGGTVRLRANSTERILLDSAGILTINDSGGAAVFTFNASSGAEFTKPLTLGANGGIYQGTGTFASPTTGLKIWRDSSIGRIGGYNSGTLQWYANTDGKLYAGGGNVVMDASGIQVSQTGGTGAYARLYPASGLIIGSKDTTIIDYSSSAMPGTFSFGGMTIDHLTSLGYANLDFGYATGVQQARLGVYGENTAIDSELLISSVSKNPAGTSSAAESRIILKATSWGNQPFSYEARLELDALTRRLWAFGDLRVSGSVHVDGDGGGVSGTVGLTDQSNTAANSTGTGTVKMKGGTSRDSVGFIKLYNGTTTIWIPYWTTITG